MPTPANQELYDKVKKYADKIYSKPSAYKNINTLSIYVFGSGDPDTGSSAEKGPIFYRKWFHSKNPRIL